MSNTTNYNLETFDQTAAKSVYFETYRVAVAGTGATNLKIIDDQMKVNAEAVDDLAGAGRTTETVIDNSNTIALLENKQVSTITTIGTDTYSATVSGLTLSDGMPLVLNFGTNINTGASSFNLNGTGAIPIKIADATGTYVVLTGRELKGAMLVVYNTSLASFLLVKEAKENDRVDFSTSPGGKFLEGGTTDAGFLGFVPASNFITGSNLASAIGLSNGTLQNSDTPWLKYMYNGKICFTPLKTHRHSTTWDAIYNTGSVFGTGDEGILPVAGRIGTGLSISVADNSINTTTQHFLSGTDNSDTVAVVGDSITLKGWTTSANNGTFTVVSITNTKIVVSGGTLVTEVGNRLSKLYKTSNAVTQNRTVVISGLTYSVRLMRGTSNNPTNSYADSDRDGIGVEDEWNAIVLPLHIKAKTQSWVYPQYAGNTDYWGIDLTDEDLITLSTYGSGSFSWCQDVNDLTTWRRVIRGYYGASSLHSTHSWIVYSGYGFRPVLELIG